MTTTRTQPHVPALDGLRALAIVGVVAFHVAVVASEGAPWAYRRPPPVWTWPLFGGPIGVDVFFVLSGFLVLRSWNAVRQREDTGRAVWQFIGRRARRILPPYYATLVVLIPWLRPEWLSLDGLREIFLFASVNQFLDPDLPRQLNVVTWALTTEVHFYVVLPLIAVAFARFGWRRTLLATLAISIGWRVLMGGTGGMNEWIPGRIDQFAAGMAAAALVAEDDDGQPSRARRWLARRQSGWILGATLIAVTLTHGALRLVPKPLAWLALFHAVAGLAIAGLIFRAVAGDAVKPLGAKPFRFAALISYSWFLWHWPFLAEFSSNWGRTAGVLAAAVAVGLAVSLLSYAALERPLVGRRPNPARSGV